MTSVKKTPVYRPEQKRVVQPKMASAAPARIPPKSPPVYRPQPVPKCLQMKATARQPLGHRAKSAPAAPPVYRPQPAGSHKLLVQAKKAATNMHPQRSSRVIQRVIIIAGKEYSHANKEEFEKTYPSNERDEMWTAIRAEKGRPETLDQTLEVPRRFKLVREDLGKHGISFYVKSKDPFVEELEGGGFTREAGKRPILVTRPERGSEELRIEGLVSCVAIIIEAKLKGMVQAAAGSHFLTPKRVSENKLNVKGSQLLENQLAMVKSSGPYDSLRAILVHSFEDKQESTKAVDLITSFLGSKSVAVTTFQKQSRNVKYRLKADGEGTLLFG